MNTLATRYPVFVYGTLRPGAGNHYLWRGKAEARYDDEAFVIGFKLTTQGWFPYLVEAATAQTVGCLIYPFHHAYDAVIADMDRLEGVPSHYSRIEVVVVTPDGPVRAWTYTPTSIYDRLLAEVPIDERGFHNWRMHRRRVS